MVTTESQLALIGNRRIRNHRCIPIINRVKHLATANGVEVGVYKGDNASKLLFLLPNLTLYMVDPWAPFTDNVNQLPDSSNAYLMQDAYLKAFSIATAFKSRCNIIRLPSIKAVLQFEDNSLDFVFIDDSHTYDNVKIDITVWYPKVKSGGWLCGHDYDTNRYPGVVAAVRESLNTFELDVDNTWFHEKL